MLKIDRDDLNKKMEVLTNAMHKENKNVQAANENANELLKDLKKRTRQGNNLDK